MSNDPREGGAVVPTKDDYGPVKRTSDAELFYLMHELSRLTSTYFDQVMVAHQLTRAQWWGIMHISENEGMTQSEIASILQLGRAATGKLLERMEAKGWIERRPDEHDSRARRVFLNPNGAPPLGIMAKEGDTLFDVFLAGVSKKETAAILSGLRKIKANAEGRLNNVK